MTIDTNLQLFDRARAVIPGGVNSPVRAFRAGRSQEDDITLVVVRRKAAGAG